MACAAICATTLASTLYAGGADYTLRFGESQGAVGGEATIAVLLDVAPTAAPVAAWSIGVCHGAEVDIVSLAQGNTTAALDPAFEDSQLVPGSGWAIGVILSFVGSTTIEPGNGYSLHLPRYALLAEGDATLSYCNTIGAPTPVETLISDPSSATVPPTQIDGVISIGLVPPIECRLASSSASAGESVELAVTVDNPVAFEGFAFGARGTAMLMLDSVTAGSALQAATGGLGPEYFAVNLSPAGGVGLTVACLIRTSPPLATVPPGVDQEIAIVGGVVDAAAPTDEVIPVTFASDLGSPAVLTRFSVGGVGVTPILSDGAVMVLPGGTQFLRGDIDLDGMIGLGDAIFLASYLFGSGASPGCLVAADVNDDGALALDDVIVHLGYQFSGGTAPAAPFPSCGVDPTPDALTCLAATICP